MDAAIAGIIGAGIGAGGTFLVAFLARATERQRAARETMISQADRVARELRTCVYALECVLAGKSELVMRGSDDGAPEEVQALDLARAAHVEAAGLVASTHALFHRRAYSHAEWALDDLANALARVDSLSDGADGVTPCVEKARVNAAAFAECAGADIRWPSLPARARAPNGNEPLKQQSSSTTMRLERQRPIRWFSQVASILVASRRSFSVSAEAR